MLAGDREGRARAAGRPPPARQRGSSADRERQEKHQRALAGHAHRQERRRLPSAGAAGASVQVSAALVALAGSRFGQPDGGAEKRLAKVQWSGRAGQQHRSTGRRASRQLQSAPRGGRPPPRRCEGGWQGRRGGGVSQGSGKAAARRRQGGRAARRRLGAEGQRPRTAEVDERCPREGGVSVSSSASQDGGAAASWAEVQ